MKNNRNGYIVGYERVGINKDEPSWVFVAIPCDTYEEAKEWALGTLQNEWATTRNVDIYKRV